MADAIVRRRFLSSLSIGLAGVAGAVLSIPILGYLLSPLIRPSPRAWVDLGGLREFPLGATVLRKIQNPSPLPWAGQTAVTAAWGPAHGRHRFRRLRGQLYAPGLPC